MHNKPSKDGIIPDNFNKVNIRVHEIGKIGDTVHNLFDTTLTAPNSKTATGRIIEAFFERIDRYNSGVGNIESMEIETEA